MTGILVLLLFGHGAAHLVGFMGPWRLIDAEGVTFQRSLFDGRLEVSDRGMRALGVVWLGLALGFFAAGLAAAFQLSWWPEAATGLAVASLLMCVTSWPAARIGVAVNVVLLVGLQIARAAHWL